MRLRYLLPCLALFSAWPAHAALTLLDKDSWKFTTGGFIEFDAINDSTRSFTEVIGSGPVTRVDDASGNGANGRTQFSLRNSRFYFNVEAPSFDGFKPRGYLEFDLLGFDPSPGSSNTEAGLYNNPTLRMRHGYMLLEKDDFQLLVGQTWMLLGWQPYYFLNTVNVAPIPATLYGRTAQIRAMQTMPLGRDTNLQAAVAMMRPPQRDASFPGFEAGLRWSTEGRKSGFTGGSTGPVKTQPLSLGLSGTLREFRVQSSSGPSSDSTTFPGAAVALNTLIPVIASPDGKDVGNTLSLLGEVSTGDGYGDQFTSYTGGLASPLSNSSTAATANKTAAARNLNLDAGIGDFDANGAFHLIHLLTYNLQFQYHFSSESRTWIDAGYSRIYSNNVGTLVSTSGRTSANTIPYVSDDAFFANVFHNFSDQFRGGLEYLFVRTKYFDNAIAQDNRYQASLWFLF
jgi:hypothetical protein